MKFLSSLVVSIVAFSSPALAFTSFKDAMDQSRLLDSVQDSGTRVIYNPSDCKDRPGLHGYYATTRNAQGEYLRDEMGLCLGNHQTLSQLNNTVRHEAIHVAQECNQGPLLPMEYWLPKLSEQTKHYLQGYDIQDLPYEVEAWHSAEVLTNEQVNVILREYCKLD